MSRVTIRATLPFPVRVEPTPYDIKYGEVVWRLTFERVQRENPDERIAVKGTQNIDLQVDRSGQLAYSRVTAETSLNSADESVLQLFLGALNFFISHARDVLGEYWIRPLRAAELYLPTVIIDGVGSTYFTPALGGAFTLAVVGLSKGANERLIAATQSGKEPPVWRQMHLDARDALSVGRDEDAVVLAWSALESACRQNLPGMAHRAGLGVGDLWDRLGRPRGRKGTASKEPPLSYEEAVGRVSGGLKIVEETAALGEPQIYHASSVSGSVALANRLRNRIVHQGVRVRHHDAERVWQSVDFVLQSALSLRNVDPPPPTSSWETRFGGVRPEVAQFASSNRVRLVVAQPEGPFFDMELIGDELWLRFATDMGEASASFLVRTEWDSWRRCSEEGKPHLVEGPPCDVLLSGLVSFEVTGLNRAVCLAEALAALTGEGEPVTGAAGYAASRTIGSLAAGPTIDPNDARHSVAAARLAAYLSILSEERITHLLGPLRPGQPEIARLSARWARAMAANDPGDAHGRCAALRAIHADGMWLDTIQVLCPVERLIYGSGRFPLA